MIVQIRSLHGGIGESAATGEAAAAAVGARHHLLHLVDTRILLNLELLRQQEKQQGENQSKTGQNRYCPDDSCHFFFM